MHRRGPRHRIVEIDVCDRQTPAQNANPGPLSSSSTSDEKYLPHRLTSKASIEAITRISWSHSILSGNPCNADSVSWCRFCARGGADTRGVRLAAGPAVPYDLRHAAVSTWLNAGVPSTQDSRVAGHGVGVLHQIYAKSLARQEAMARRRIDATLQNGGRTP